MRGNVLEGENMRSTPSLILTLLIVLAATINTPAYLEDYSPFIKSKPKLFSLKKLDITENTDNTSFSIVRNGRNTTLLKLFACDSCESSVFLLSIYDASGKLVKDSARVSDSLTSPDAYMADLNGDGKQDYVIQIRTVASGLGIYKDFIMIAISSGNSYEVETVDNWDSDSVLKDFVDLKKNGHWQFIHTSFTYTEDKRGNSRHSHWVYNILELRGTKLVLVNHLYPMYPKWVWYTNRPNHRASPFVNRAAAIRWSRSEYPSFFWKASGTEG
jgi:hypothetical protein